MSGPCCVEPGAKQTHEPVGDEVVIDGLKTYKTGDGNSAIVIFTDVFGFSFINTRMLADQFVQSTGATVLVPDFFNGDPMNPNEPNLIEKLPAWREKHPVREVCQMADRFIASIEDNYQSIQIIGFCYGAKPVVHLVIQSSLTPKIKAAAVAHPTFLVAEEASEIKRPILFLCAETDQRFPPDLRQHFEKTLTPTGLSTFIDFPGTVHGFVIRPDGTEHVKQQRDKAVQHAIDFFKKYF